MVGWQWMSGQVDRESEAHENESQASSFRSGPHVVIFDVFFKFYFCILVAVINGGTRSFSPWDFSFAVVAVVFYNDMDDGFTMFNPKKVF